jgi:hypothetical protein
VSSSKVNPGPRPNHYRTFRERFCEKFTCDPTAFERRVLFEALDPVPRFFARLLYAWKPSALETDRTILRRVSHMDTVPDVLRAVQDIDREYIIREDFGALRRFLHIRLSRERILRLTAQIWDRPPNYALVLRQ